MIPLELVPIIGILILLFIIWTSSRDFLKAPPKERKKLIKIYAVVGTISLLLFFGIQQSGISQKMFPGYYQFEIGNGPIDWESIGK